jgi:hypothetical protein
MILCLATGHRPISSRKSPLKGGTTSVDGDWRYQRHSLDVSLALLATWWFNFVPSSRALPCSDPWRRRPGVGPSPFLSPLWGVEGTLLKNDAPCLEAIFKNLKEYFNRRWTQIDADMDLRWEVRNLTILWIQSFTHSRPSAFICGSIFCIFCGASLFQTASKATKPRGAPATRTHGGPSAHCNTFSSLWPGFRASGFSVRTFG